LLLLEREHQRGISKIASRTQYIKCTDVGMGRLRCTLSMVAHWSPCCWQAASQVGHAANDGGATTSAIHCWLPSIHCARPHGLEFLAGWPPHTAGLWVL